MTARFRGREEPELHAGAPALRALALDGFDADGFDADAFKSPSAFFASLGVTERTVMRHQVVELILDILAATDPGSEVRLRLLRHLVAHPGCPEQALLCHLRENALLPLSAVPGFAPAEASDDLSEHAAGGRSPGRQSPECPDSRTGLLRLPD
ncbi:hypothetical protein [Arthrobacter sp. ISL-5]|uniref:hypothetical protein n=1 Tax=Arthrobacter sp. ISL-5 TaxID=2819111 RepID=UPI001BE9AEA1|nr:hypothetical protein [Arthrobacter sp. ISL-5]MBT2553501.1 hypothetical protein [Arthrobacter sp. ISL-5]